MLRGNAGDPVFFDESDRCRFYLLIQEGAVRFGFRIHAFCCMTNRYSSGAEVLPWLTTDLTLSLFSPDRGKARQAYGGFVDVGLAEGRVAEFHSGTCEGRILGDDGFVDEILAKIHKRDHRPHTIPVVIEAVCDLYALTPDALRAPGKTHPASEGRTLAAWLAREVPQLSLTELVRYLDRDVAALSQAARRLATQAVDNSELAARCGTLQRLVFLKSLDVDPLFPYNNSPDRLKRVTIDRAM